MIRTKISFILIACSLIPGCASVEESSGTQYSGSIPVYEQSAPTMPNVPRLSARLLLFGGADHDVFLGCLSCNEYDSDSIFNEFGDYGSEYTTTSIWNRFGEYGSQFSNYSPWNPYATSPPVVVDDAGNFYGYFTVNEFHPKRTRLQGLIALLATHRE